MFCACDICKGNLLTVGEDKFSMIRCKCKTGIVCEHEVREKRKKEEFKSDLEKENEPPLR